MARRPKLNWEVYREQLEHLRYTEKKSLTDINKILYEKLGFCFTNARLSQVFNMWSNEQSGKQFGSLYEPEDVSDMEVGP